ncbi:hypothetical protein BAE44_0000595, partial [Dichanthelium oligosanthes]
LATTLTAAFTWKIGALLPVSFATATWIMAAATVLGGFYVLFVHYFRFDIKFPFLMRMSSGRTALIGKPTRNEKKEVRLSV